MSVPPTMSKSERADLQRLLRQREKVFKSAAKQRSAELLADFENQMGEEYSFDQDEVWEQAAKAAEHEIRKAQALISARCRDLGIPKQFAPDLGVSWRHGGGSNVLAARRAELRRMAQREIEAIERKAITEIELSCLDAQRELAFAGLTSELAKSFIERLPAVEVLMPRLSFAEIAGESEPPLAERVISPNALRQRRYRERQAALRNAGRAVTAPSRNADDGDVELRLAADRGARAQFNDGIRGARL